MTTTTDTETETLSPTETLALEVLAARHRLGEHLWTFESRMKPTLNRLAARGLVDVLPGIVEKSVRASLTDAGLQCALGSDYRSPVEEELQRHKRAAADILEKALDLKSRMNSYRQAYENERDHLVTLASKVGLSDDLPSDFIAARIFAVLDATTPPPQDVLDAALDAIRTTRLSRADVETSTPEQIVWMTANAIAETLRVDALLRWNLLDSRARLRSAITRALADTRLSAAAKATVKRAISRAFQGEYDAASAPEAGDDIGAACD